MKTLQQAADELMEAMQDEANLARRKDQTLLDALAKRSPQKQQASAAKAPDVATREGSQ